MPTAYLSLGSNLGDRAANLEQALTRLQSPSVRLQAVSSLYETVPVGETATPVPLYLNVAARVETDLPPEALLSYVQSVEQEGGRERSYQWAPRTIDIDILLYDDLEMETENLTIPHPRMFERAFVLIPLAEIAPDLMFPDGSGLGDRLAHPIVREQQVVLADQMQRRTGAP